MRAALDYFFAAGQLAAAFYLAWGAFLCLRRRPLPSAN
jgi:hypothetical protein